MDRLSPDFCHGAPPLSEEARDEDWCTVLAAWVNNCNSIVNQRKLFKTLFETILDWIGLDWIGLDWIVFDEQATQERCSCCQDVIASTIVGSSLVGGFVFVFCWRLAVGGQLVTQQKRVSTQSYRVASAQFSPTIYFNIQH